MQAGQRAQLKAEQLEAAVEDARRKLAQAEQRLHAWKQGAEGERRTSQVLTALAAQGWLVLHDLHWPGRPYANIDHIAVGPTGVFVIDSKNWSGQVQMRDGVLRQNGYSRQGECDAVASATAAVAAFLEPQHRGLVTAVLCLVGHATPPQQPSMARVVGLADLNSLLTAGESRIRAIDVERIGPYLRGLLDGSRSPDQKTTAVFASLGAAPTEPSAGSRRQVRRAAASSRPGARRRRAVSRPQRHGSGRRVVLALVQLAIVAVMGLYVLPRALHAVGDSLTPAPRTTPTVTTRTTPTTGATSKHHRTATAKPTNG